MKRVSERRGPCVKRGTVEPGTGRIIQPCVSVRTCANRSDPSSVPGSAVPIAARASLIARLRVKTSLPYSTRPRPPSAHERYADGPRRAPDSRTTALGRDWLAAAQASIRQPLTVALPFREAGYFAASEARAVGYAVRLRDGQRLSAIAETSGAPLTIFLDLFRQTGDTANPLDLVASVDTSLTTAGCATRPRSAAQRRVRAASSARAAAERWLHAHRVHRAIARVSGLRPRQQSGEELLRCGSRRRRAASITASTSSRRAERRCSPPLAASSARSRLTISVATSCGSRTTSAARRCTMRTSTATT